MGQYFYVVNLDKKEFLHPHKFGDGLKLMEFGSSGGGTLTGLTLLMATSNGLGGGDFNPRGQYGSDEYKEDSKFIATIAGRWAGDRIAFIGDYDDSEEFGGVYNECGEIKEDDGTSRPGLYTDISYDVVRVMARDTYFKDEFKKNEMCLSIWAHDGFDPEKR